MGEVNKKPTHLLLAFVGMPGAGKSGASQYLSEKGIPFIRFGKFTDEEVARRGLPLTPENERLVRENLRATLGMAAYAIKAKPKIEALLAENKTIVLDGLYSWEEYTFLKQAFPSLIVIHIYTEAAKRYERLAKRTVRPFSKEEARSRDIAEIEQLHKGGPIAIADYLLENNEDSQSLYQKIDQLLTRLGVTNK